MNYATRKSPWYYRSTVVLVVELNFYALWEIRSQLGCPWTLSSLENQLSLSDIGVILLICFYSICIFYSDGIPIGTYLDGFWLDVPSGASISETGKPGDRAYKKEW